MNNMIIKDITYSSKKITVSKKGVEKNDLFKMIEENNIDQYLNQLEEKTIVYLITVTGEINFDGGYKYIRYPESLPNFTGKSEASFSIMSRPGLGHDSMSYGLVVKWI